MEHDKVLKIPDRNKILMSFIRFDFFLVIFEKCECKCKCECKNEDENRSVNNVNNDNKIRLVSVIFSVQFESFHRPF